jgi:hypothetical protein
MIFVKSKKLLLFFFIIFCIFNYISCSSFNHTVNISKYSFPDSTQYLHIDSINNVFKTVSKKIGNMSLSDTIEFVYISESGLSINNFPKTKYQKLEKSVYTRIERPNAIINRGPVYSRVFKIDNDTLKIFSCGATLSNKSFSFYRYPMPALEYSGDMMNDIYASCFFQESDFKKTINRPKSNIVFHFLSILSPTLSTVYVSHNNPFYQPQQKYSNLITSSILDLAGVTMLFYPKNNKSTKLIGESVLIINRLMYLVMSSGDVYYYNKLARSGYDINLMYRKNFYLLGIEVYR